MPNEPPTLDLNGPGTAGLDATLAYDENDAATAVAPLASLGDLDSADFDGGILNVGFAVADTSNQLGIQNQGTGPGQIGVSGGDVTYGGVTIGTFTPGAGSNGGNLPIFFNSSASPAAVEALTRALLYSNSSDNPSAAERDLIVVVTDGDGGSVTQHVTVEVTPTNDPPTIDDATDPASPVAETAGDSAAQDIDAVGGTISITDADIGDTLTLGVAGDADAVYSGGVLPGSVDVAALVAAGAVSFGPLLESTGGQQTVAWTYDPEAADLDWLAEGETLTITYTAQADDGAGPAGAQPLVITIEGTNDAPTIDSVTDPAAPVAEAAGDSSAQDIDAVGGTISVTDADIGDTLSLGVAGDADAVYSGGALPGSVDVAALVAAGAVSFGPLLPSTGGQQTVAWTYDPVAADLDWLAEGETLTITYTAQADDGAGPAGAQPLTITIEGANDAPVVTGAVDAGGVTEAVDNSADETGDLEHSAGGTVDFTDADLSDTHTATYALVSATDSATGASTAERGSLAVEVSTDATGGATGTVAWSFTVDDSLIDDLAEGQTITQVYSIAIDDDGVGAASETAAQEMTVTLTGVNDAPVVDASGSAALALSESSEAAGDAASGAFTDTGGGGPTLSGALAFSDVDLIDTHTLSVLADVAVAGTGPTPPASLALHDLLTADLVTDTTGGAAGSIGYAFDAGENGFDYLAGGETVALTYTLQIDDGNGGVDTRDVTVTVTGANDTPDIAVGSADSAALALTESSEASGQTALGALSDTGGGGPTLTGTLSFSDPDYTDTHAVSVEGVTLTGTGPTPPDGLDLASLLTAELTAETSSGADGVITYTFGGAENDFDYLAAGETAVLSYRVRVTDDGPSALYDEQTVTVTVTGVNDAPDATGDTLSVAEDAASVIIPKVVASTVSALANDTDPDRTDTLVVHAVAAGAAGALDAAARSAVGQAVHGVYGDLILNADGSYSYAFLNTDALIAGESAEDVFHYQVSDGHGGLDDATLTVTVSGTDLDLTITPTGDPHDAAPFIAQRGDDVVRGNDGVDNTIYGRAGNDTLYGYGGADHLFGEAGADTLDGGAGDDLLDGGTGADAITGGLGGDTVIVAAASDYAAGETIDGTAEAGTADTLRLDDAGTYALTDSRVVNIDAIRLNENAAGFNVAVGNGLVATADDDGDGTGGDLRIGALVAMSNGVTVDASALTGVNHVLVEGANLRGADVLKGGAGADTLNGGGGADAITGGLGGDTIIVTAVSDYAAGETVDGGAEAGTADTLRLDDAGAYALTDSRVTNIDAIRLNENAAGFNLTVGNGLAGTADDDGNGTGGDLRIGALVAMTNGVTIDASALTGVNRVIVEGTNLGGADILKGGAGADALNGGGGGDSITGGLGADSLAGAAGDDVFTVAGSDAVAGETYDGGDNSDTLSVSGNADFTGSTILSVERLALSAGVTFTSNQLQPNGLAAALAVTGQAPADDAVTVKVVGGATTVDLSGWTFATWTGGADDDRIVIDGTALAVSETLTGTSQYDVIRAGAGADTLHGGAGGDLLYGNAGVDSVSGDGGNDTIFGGLSGGDGNDAYDGGADNDTLDYAATTLGVTASLAAGSASGAEIGTDTLAALENVTGGAGADRLIGNDVVNLLSGGGDVDNIWGNGGNDEIRGGDGNDQLVGGYGGDLAGSGNDTMFGDAGSDTLFGEDGNDVLWGGTGTDQYAGGAGNDTLNFEGDGESDTAWGGTESDIFVFKTGFGVDTIKDFLAVGPYADKIDLSAFNTSFSALSIKQVGSNVEITGLGAGNKIVLEVVNANAVTADDFIFKAAGAAGVTINGTKNADVIDGSRTVSGQPLPTGLADTILGNAGNDTMSGLAGNDRLDGGAGADTMIGGSGNDTYVVDNAADVVDETTGGIADVDLVQASISFSLADTARVKGAVENLTLTGTAAINATGDGSANVLTGNSGSNILDGRGGADQLDGGGGADTVTYAASGAGVTVSLLAGAVGLGGDAAGDTLTNIENLTGSAYDDTLAGNAGNNVLAGGANAASGDTVTYANATGGVSVSLAVTTAQATGGAGSDTLSGFENLTGSSFADTLTGSSGNNILIGGGGADTLNGNGGVDTMIGGAGSDTYVVDGLNDLVTEGDGEGDNDTIRSSITYSLAALAFVESLTLTGSAALAATGNEAANTLTGNTGANTLTGLGGADKLDGGGGADLMIGGSGGDTYVVDNAGDVVDESGGNAFEIDKVQSSITFSLSDGVHAKGDVELLALTGSAAINGTGNGLANTIDGNSGNNILAGLGGADQLNGGGGIDTATYATSPTGVEVSLTTNTGHGGDAEGDTLSGIENLTGSAHDDILEGNAGSNVLAGGGNDAGGDTVTYEHLAGSAGVKVSLAVTTAQATGGAGSDTLSGFENLTGSGNGDTLTGSTGNNVLSGLAGNDTISGGNGNDTLFGGQGTDKLTGGSGADTFVFNFANQGNDNITDFAHGADILQISAAGFGGNLVAEAPLDPTDLVAATNFAAANHDGADGYFIYVGTGADSGKVYWDASGGSGADAVQIATLQAGATLTSSDFHIV